jgi:hypothetical protein
LSFSVPKIEAKYSAILLQLKRSKQNNIYGNNTHKYSTAQLAAIDFLLLVCASGEDTPVQLNVIARQHCRHDVTSVTAAIYSSQGN